MPETEFAFIYANHYINIKMETNSDKKGDLLRNSLSNHRKLKPASQVSLSRLGIYKNLASVESMKDIANPHTSHPALININISKDPRENEHSSVSPRAANTSATDHAKTSHIERNKEVCRPQSGRNIQNKNTAQQRATAENAKAPGKKKSTVVNVPSESSNVFSRLTSGVSGLNGAQYKVVREPQKANGDWIDAYSDLKGDLTSASQFQNKFRRSIAPQSGHVSGSNQSNNSREGLKNISSLKEIMLSKGDQQYATAQFVDNYGSQVQIDNLADYSSNRRVNRIPKRTNKPPKLPATQQSSHLSIGLQENVKIQGDEGQGPAAADLDVKQDARANEKLHQVTSMAQHRRKKSGNMTTSTPREHDYNRSNSNHGPLRTLGLPAQMTTTTISHKQMPVQGQLNPQESTAKVSNQQAQRNRAKKYRNGSQKNKQASLHHKTENSMRKDEQKSGRRESYNSHNTQIRSPDNFSATTSMIQKNGLKDHSRRQSKNAAANTRESGTWNDSFFADPKQLKEQMMHKSPQKSRVVPYEDYKTQPNIQTSTLDDLLEEDGQTTTEGQMTLNGSRVPQQLNPPKLSEQKKMNATVNDGSSIRFYRLHKVSKNYKEMKSSIDRGVKKPPHRADQIKSFESVKSGGVTSSHGGLSQSLASQLIQNKDQLIRLRDERQRTLEREKQETITIQYQSELPESTIYQDDGLTTIDANLQTLDQAKNEPQTDREEPNMKSPEVQRRFQNSRNENGSRLYANLEVPQILKQASNTRNLVYENQQAALNINTSFETADANAPLPRLSATKDQPSQPLTTQNKQQRGRKTNQDAGASTEADEVAKRGKDQVGEYQSLHDKKQSGRQGSKDKQQKEREATNGPCQRSMASHPTDAGKTAVGAGTQPTKGSKEPKNTSLSIEDIVLESDNLDMEKIRQSITFEQFLRQQVRIIKKSRSRSRGPGEQDYAEVALNQQAKQKKGEKSPHRPQPGKMAAAMRPDTARLAKLTHWVQKKFGEQSIFVGQLGAESERCGLGVMKYQNGRQYEGAWKDDLREGEGFERYQNGNSYAGRFQNGKAHGQGVYSWNNGEVYDGEWDQGLKHGHGLWKGVHNDSYCGEWFKSQAHGYGVHIWPNGDRFEGEWKMGLKHGSGSDQLACGDSYVGEYKNGKMHGKGVFTWSTGQQYNGEYVNGKRHGKGKWRSQNNLAKCSSYEGEYRNDKKHGYGVYTWASGNVYKGEYWDDERNGQGKMEWTDGSCYEGEWRNGIQHGYGKMTFPNGQVKEGIFEDNVFKGNADSANKRDTIAITNQSYSYYDEETEKSDFDFHRKSRDQANATIQQTEGDHDQLSPGDIEIQSGKALKRMPLQSPDKLHIINQTQALDQDIDTADKRPGLNRASMHALAALKDNATSAYSQIEQKPEKRPNKTKTQQSFTRQARATVQDQLRFMEQTGLYSSDVSEMPRNAGESGQAPNQAPSELEKIDDWDADDQKERVHVPEQAQQDYKQKIELLKSQMKSENTMINDSSFIKGNLDPSEEDNDPKSAAHGKSRMRTLQQFEDAQGSQTELKPRRKRDHDEFEEEFMAQIQQAIRDERTGRHLKKKKKKRKPKEPSGEQYPKEMLREWSFEDNF